MANYVQLPNGSYYEAQEGQSYLEAIRDARRYYPEAFGETPAPTPKKGGITGALGLGLESLLSSYRTAAGAVTDPEQAARAALERQQALGEKYEAPTSLERVKQAYTERGFLPAAKEVVSQIPGAIAEQVPQLGTIFGGARLGAMAGAPLGPVGATIGGVGGAAAALLPQFFGSNVQRQAAEQVERGEPVQIDRGSALAAAAGQTAAEAAGTALVFGGRLVSQLTKIPENALLLGNKNAQKLADERLRDVLLKGTAKGFAAELPTEIAQQMAERAQAGLSLTDSDALAEYGQTAYQVGLLSPLGAVGRASERSGARQEVEKQRKEAQDRAAQELETAQTQPDALQALYANYTQLDQQKQQMDAAFDALSKTPKPGKKATPEEKAAYVQAQQQKQQLAAQRKEFMAQYQPVEQEYNKRKDLIEQMLQAQQSALETATPQEAQVAPIPTTEPTLDVQRLMLEQDTLRNQLTALETQLESVAPEQFDELNAQRQDLQKRIDARAALIEERGGSPLRAEEFERSTGAQMQAYNTKLDQFTAAYTKALQDKDYDKAQKAKDDLLKLKQEREAFTNKTAEQMRALQEKQAGLQSRGETRELFGGITPPKTEEQRQLEQQTRGEEQAQAAYMRGEAPTAAEPKATEVIQPKQLEAVEAAKTQVGAAEQAFTQLAQNKDTKTPDLYRALDEYNKAANTLSAAQEDIGRPTLKSPIIDIFSPANIMQEAVRRGDWATVLEMVRQMPRSSIKAALDEKATERERLINVLEGRLDSEGIKRERADLFSQIYDKEAQAKFKNGTYADKELQALYDKGGPAAVENEWVSQQVAPLTRKVTTPQGNAKKSLYQQLIETAAEHEAAVAALESGIATPTMREKTAALQAKLGKGEAPAERMMDASERYNLQRRITTLENKYRMIEGKIKPIRDQILQLHGSLYTTTKLEKPSVIKAKQQAASDAEGRAPKAKSRSASTAARLARGDVRREAQASEKLRNLAVQLGQAEPDYAKFEKELERRFEALKKRYGAEDKAVATFRNNMGKERLDKAMELGKKTPEYKRTLKEQVEYFKEVLPTAGKQEVPTKRTGAVTRKQSAAPKRLVSSSEESKAESKLEQRAYAKYRGSLKAMQEALDAEKAGREDERFARGVEVESPDLTPTQINALEENDLTAALSDIANDKKNSALNRAVAQRLAALLDDTKVQVEDKLSFDGKEVLGAATSKLVQINRNGGLSQEVLLHEGTHAAAERVIVQFEQAPDKLTEQQRVAARELKAIFEVVKNDARITSVNAKSSLSEFVAEVMSNSKLQEQLREKPWRMSDMLRAFKSAILRMIGIKPNEVETMLGASIAAVDALFIPSSARLGITEQRVTRKLSARDIAALHDGSNSMQQFADQFGPLIKQADRKPEDVERIAMDYIYQMESSPKQYVPLVDPKKLDYTSSTIMSDGKPYDADNPLHYVEATPVTFAALEAQTDPGLRSSEAMQINSKRIKDFRSLLKLLQKNPSYTLAEQALVTKAASQYGVVSDKNGRLKLAVLDDNNRHGVAVVSQEAADAVIRELRAGKSLKKAFLEGLQANADASAKTNNRKNGWQKFDQASGKSAAYTEKEIEDALGQTGYDPNTFATETELVEQLVRDGLLPDRTAPSLEESAIALNAGAAGTPWCTGGSVSTARSQIEGGDFYIYYKNGKPEVAVRMNGQNEIGEVRGNNPDQALDAEQQKIAREFLENSQFSNANKYVEEFALKEKLTAIAKGTAEFTVGDLLNFGSSPIDSQTGAVDTKAVKRLLKFRTVDGYANRPEPSAAVAEFFGNELKDAVFAQYAKNSFLYSTVSVYGDNLKNSLGKVKRFDKKIEVEFGGQTFATTSDELIAANMIAFYPTQGLDFVLPKLRFANLLYLHGDGKDNARVTVDLPALKRVNEVVTFSQEKGGSTLILPSDASVRELRGYSENDTYIEVRGPRRINRVVQSRNKRLLHAYLPDTQYFQLSQIPLSGEKTIKAPNFIAPVPPIDTLTEVPETPRFAPKGVGVVEEAPRQFSFRRQRTKSDSVVAQEPGLVDKVLGNVMGLAGRVQLVDQYAALDRAVKEGMDAGQINSLEATNAQYLLRFGQQRSMYAGQFLTHGPVQLELAKKDGVTTSVFRSVKGTTMLDVAEALNAAKLASPIEQENMFTVYLAGERAQQPGVGWEKLNFKEPAKAKAEYDAVMAQLNANSQAKKAFEIAKKLYQQYNAGLLDWLGQTGVLSPQKVAELKAITYVPYYRVSKNGEVQLMIDKETPVRISNIKDEPQLQELVGGNDAIMPVFTSAVQNTFMITNLGLRNQTVKETAFLLQKLGIASRLGEGAGPVSPNTVRFKKSGKDFHAVIDTDLYGIPADLIVKGMEGIKTTVPAIVRLMGYPADILRKFVTRMPAYAVRQIIRDPLNAWLTTGTDAVPVISSLKELASMVAGRSEAERKLMTTGAISSNVFSGDEQDMTKFIKDISAGKSLWAKTLAKADTFALQGDAATRAVIYKDSLAKGMSEQEALLRTLESMNFSRKGVSPSMQMLSVLIPFFNAQVQGLDVVYRAFKGDMPYSEQLKIREKLMARGALLALGTIAYAAMMEDDEAYKRAKPEERYASWFVYVPGVSEPVRVPIPFELGFLFKALPEAVYNLASGDDKSSKVLSGLGKMLNQSNPFALPQAIKPLTEVVLGKSFYSGDIESMREKEQIATQRYRENTTEVSKLLGQVTGNAGISPISIDYLIRGYFGGLGIALVQLANPVLASDQKEIAEPSTKPSKLPLIGGLFQPAEGRGTLDEAYNRMLEIRQVKGSYNKLVEQGKLAEAREFAQNYSNDLAQMSVSGRVQKQLGELAKQERAVRASQTLSTEEKDKRLEQLDKIKIQIARQFLALPR